MGSPSPEPPGPSILVVEVDKPLREDVSRTLKRAGYEVVLAGTGEEALDLIAAADFDGLYCEVQLPGEIDGWEAAPPSASSGPTSRQFMPLPWCPDRRDGCGTAISCASPLLWIGS